MQSSTEYPSAMASSPEIPTPLDVSGFVSYRIAMEISSQAILAAENRKNFEKAKQAKCNAIEASQTQAVDEAASQTQEPTQVQLQNLAQQQMALYHQQQMAYYAYMMAQQHQAIMMAQYQQQLHLQHLYNVQHSVNIPEPNVASNINLYPTPCTSTEPADSLPTSWTPPLHCSTPLEQAILIASSANTTASVDSSLNDSKNLQHSAVFSAKTKKNQKPLKHKENYSETEEELVQLNDEHMTHVVGYVANLFEADESKVSPVSSSKFERISYEDQQKHVNFDSKKLMMKSTMRTQGIQLLNGDVFPVMKNQPIWPMYAAQPVKEINENVPQEIVYSSLRLKRHNRNYKTEMCKNVSDGSECPRGEACGFAHNKEELRELSSNNTINSTKLCRAYSTTGFCLYGDKCRFQHKFLNGIV
ncbi:unnamed protein product [Bursaphelenchus okinawaensis]|uniref:C3H1-type domain-containing protein n=1 Tax=Bursaphelenchus okinawaensis TaxID=465554 RepID=A0A811JQK4_9BILA|nr:unnamed protein product [Bursaphelenchus okinawaensis]CAG9078415.1 unnamed protein product [Bursaphelenchus okinawaensis]